MMRAPVILSAMLACAACSPPQGEAAKAASDQHAVAETERLDTAADDVAYRSALMSGMIMIISCAVVMFMPLANSATAPGRRSPNWPRSSSA